MSSAHIRPDFDLQSHSVHSDGALAPAEVVALAAAAGMRLMSLTDHDTVDGVEEALAAARGTGVRCSPAAELSAVEGDFEDLHVLGYELRHDDPELRDTLADFRADRGRRISAMADRLEELGFALDRARARGAGGAGRPLGRPHLADAVLRHPANAARLADEGIDGQARALPAPTSSPARAPTSPARGRPSTQAIEVIHAAGGVAVWAHPFWDVADAETALATLERFAGRRARRRGVLLRHPHGGADAAAPRRGARARAPHHRLDRLPRARARALQRLRRLRAHGLEPDLGPIGA